MKRLGHTAGFSLVELVLGLTLMTVIAGAMIVTTDSTGKAMRTGSLVSQLDSAGHRALDRIGERLSEATRDDVLPPFPAAETPFHTWQIDYQPTEFDGAAVVPGDAARIVFEYSPGDPDDGVDNDGNGQIDEGQVVFIELPGMVGERRTVLCRWVSEFLEGEIPDNGLDDNGNELIDERGLSFDLDGNRVTIRLTLERPDPQGFLISRSFRKTIAFRR